MLVLAIVSRLSAHIAHACNLRLPCELPGNRAPKHDNPLSSLLAVGAPQGPPASLRRTPILGCGCTALWHRRPRTVPCNSALVLHPPCSRFGVHWIYILQVLGYSGQLYAPCIFWGGVGACARSAATQGARRASLTKHARVSCKHARAHCMHAAATGAQAPIWAPTQEEYIPLPQAFFACCSNHVRTASPRVPSTALPCRVSCCDKHAAKHGPQTCTTRTQQNSAPPCTSSGGGAPYCQ